MNPGNQTSLLDSPKVWGVILAVLGAVGTAVGLIVDVPAMLFPQEIVIEADILKEMLEEDLAKENK